MQKIGDMLKKLTLRAGEKEESAGKVLALQAREIEEISEKLFMKIDQRLKALKALEERLDQKTALLEELIQKAEQIPAGKTADGRYRQITELAAQGLNIDAIAGVLDMPKGEIELILSLRK